MVDPDLFSSISPNTTLLLWVGGLLLSGALGFAEGPRWEDFLGGSLEGGLATGPVLSPTPSVDEARREHLSFKNKCEGQSCFCLCFPSPRAGHTTLLRRRELYLPPSIASSSFASSSHVRPGRSVPLLHVFNYPPPPFLKTVSVLLYSVTLSL